MVTFPEPDPELVTAPTLLTLAVVKAIAPLLFALNVKSPVPVMPPLIVMLPLLVPIAALPPKFTVPM